MKNQMEKYATYFQKVENDFTLIGEINLKPFLVFLTLDFFQKRFFRIAPISSFSQYTRSSIYFDNSCCNYKSDDSKFSLYLL